MTTTTQNEWLELREASRRLDIPPAAVKRLAERGEIKTRDLPVRAIYSGVDVFRLANAQKAAAAS